MKNSLSLALVCPILGSVAIADDVVQCGISARTHIEACRRVGLWPKPASKETSVEVTAVGKFHSNQPPQEGEDLPPAPGALVQVDDPDASLPAGLGNGLHVVSSAALEDWTTLLLSDVDTAQSRPEKH